MKSRHITGHAVDLVALVDLDHDGKIETEEMFSWPLYPKIAAAVKEAARLENVPIEWGGSWKRLTDTPDLAKSISKSFPDGPHFQLPWKEYP
jgi:peptidoglycan L-alanyl-D-glutamate endopeptidase CwlK